MYDVYPNISLLRLALTVATGPYNDAIFAHRSKLAKNQLENPVQVVYTAATYLQEAIRPLESIATRRRHRSVSTGELVVPATCHCIFRRRPCFRCRRASDIEQLNPADVHSSPTLRTFKLCALKTHLKPDFSRRLISALNLVLYQRLLDYRVGLKRS